MGPKKQTQSKNSFFHFMEYLMRQKGYNHAGGMREMPAVAGPIWDAMDEKARKPFEDLAHSDRKGVRYTTQGQTFDEVEEEHRKVKEKHELMLSTIKSTLIQLGRNTGLARAPFFFVHMNFFCKKDDGTYYPAEFAIAKFTIAEGVLKIYHTMVNTGDLPQGYNLKARTHSSETHRIPLPPNVPDAERDSANIVEKIDRYVSAAIKAGESMPPFYTMSSNIEATENIMGRWAADYGRDPDYYRIFPLEQLFFHLKNFGLKPEGQRLMIRGVRDDGFLFLSLAADVLSNDEFSHTLNISCKYHEEEDAVLYCSKSLVKRWGWMLANNLCANLDIPLIPGQHVPKNTAPECLSLHTMGMQKMTLNEWSVPAPARYYRTDPAPSQAYGRGVPLSHGSTASSCKGDSSGAYYGNLEIIDHGAAAQAKAGTGSGATPRGWNKPPSSSQYADVVPSNSAASVGCNLEREQPPVDTPTRQSLRPKHDDLPLRKPKQDSLASQIAKLPDSFPALTAESFPALTADNFPGIGRGVSARGRRGRGRTGPIH